MNGYAQGLLLKKSLKPFLIPTITYHQSNAWYIHAYNAEGPHPPPQCQIHREYYPLLGRPDSNLSLTGSELSKFIS